MSKHVCLQNLHTESSSELLQFILKELHPSSLIDPSYLTREIVLVLTLHLFLGTHSKNLYTPLC